MASHPFFSLVRGSRKTTTKHPRWRDFPPVAVYSYKALLVKIFTSVLGFPERLGFNAGNRTSNSSIAEVCFLFSEILQQAPDMYIDPNFAQAVDLSFGFRCTEVCGWS